MIIDVVKDATILKIDTGEKIIRIRRDDKSEGDLGVNEFHHTVAFFQKFIDKKVNLTLWDGKIAKADEVKT